MFKNYIIYRGYSGTGAFAQNIGDIEIINQKLKGLYVVFLFAK